jgi:hypothetical protein
MSHTCPEENDLRALPPSAGRTSEDKREMLHRRAIFAKLWDPEILSTWSKSL